LFPMAMQYNGQFSVPSLLTVLMVLSLEYSIHNGGNGTSVKSYLMDDVEYRK
jgi:hypothetical protein